MSFIPKKINLIVFFQKSQTICFIPSFGHDIKGNLPSNRVSHVKVSKLLSEDIDKFFSDLMLLIINFKLISLFLGTVSSNWGYVDHSCSVFDESATLDGDVDLRKVFETEIDEFFKFFFWKVFIDWLNKKWCTWHPIC